MPHKEIVQAVRAIGGKWQKSLNTSYGESPKIDYVTELDGVQVRCWAGEPPPSCRIVEVEEHVPAQVIPAKVVKVRKMVCTPELPFEL